MKVINVISNQLKPKDDYDKIATVFVIISFIIQIIYMLILPCFIIKMKYDMSYIISMILLTLCIDAIVYIDVYFFCRYVKYNWNFIFILSFIVTTALCISVFISGNKEFLSIPDKKVYNTLIEYAESVEDEDDLYEKADKLTWYKSTEEYHAIFKSGENQLKVGYNKNFDILYLKWEDTYAIVIIGVFILIAVIMFLSVFISNIISSCVKKVKYKVD